MRQFSGFVPLRFHLAGKILLSLSVIGFLSVGLSILTGWFKLPTAIPILSLVLLIVGLDHTFVPPREGDEGE